MIFQNTMANTLMQRIRDQVLNGEINASECCSYGVCIQVGDIANRNIEGGRMKR